ncbi:hypothetical protein C789_1563 [Microcystis aeruginosa FACHB-905 = DIANCHI905]|nr:hypothetical protein C789_1563 [Microcystis aeruginosa FACHB-905 = DIANCHI905]
MISGVILPILLLFQSLIGFKINWNRIQRRFCLSGLSRSHVSIPNRV